MHRAIPRTAVLASLGLGSLGALAAPAQATFHLERVNEVMLASGSGDSSVRFVEMLDHGGVEEQFTPVFAPYRLAVYDGAGNKLGEQLLNGTGLKDAAAADRPYLISTPAADAAFGVTGDELLTVSLPRGPGQACFEANPDPPAFNCLTWGAVTKPVPTNSQGTGSANGPVPPNGQSDQRQSDDSILAASPTPKAPNRSSSAGGGPTGTTGSPAFRGVKIASRRVTVDSAGRARLRLRCPSGTNGFCRGRVTLAARRGRTKFGHASFKIASSKTKTVRVKLSRAARRLLRRHGRLRVRARGSVKDAAGKSKPLSSRLTLVAR
jgi:hypothetical protein